MSSPIIFKNPYSTSQASTSDSQPEKQQSPTSSRYMQHHRLVLKQASSTSPTQTSSSLPSSSAAGSSYQIQQQHEPEHQSPRKKSVFNTSSSPYARRKSFLSRSMLENDNFQTYEVSSYDFPISTSNPTSTLSTSSTFSSARTTLRTRIPSFSINLTQSQGFIWNQDLFASSYQQVRAGLNPDEFLQGSKSIEVVDIIVDDDNDEDFITSSCYDSNHENVSKGSCDNDETMNSDHDDDDNDGVDDDDVIFHMNY
ncbi:hypothetical protein CANARDRAFT_6037 [[Candida] arabinofermentans NRRL YB-2248]|uniref:Uncharacterized protein n=1 Tax=[Candida] arabinofermentans NRRL YB-2248 TaxID=983967 RepID=A0A1E4T6X6_9ASCO|nr:hypothetical protein CANARDRAFT_6037 [[Candida] arabinofermentans NRRL YB-2248]